MLEALFRLLFEMLLYGKGYWTLRLLSGERIQPGRWSAGLVTLVGFAVTVAWGSPLVIWLASGK